MMFKLPFPLDMGDVSKQLSKEESANAPKGAMLLVRSDYKHEVYGDHLALVVGGKILKERGLRPNLITFPASEEYKHLLDSHKPIDGSVVLLLEPLATRMIMEQFGIHLSTGELTNL